MEGLQKHRKVLLRAEDMAVFCAGLHRISALRTRSSLHRLFPGDPRLADCRVETSGDDAVGFSDSGSSLRGSHVSAGAADSHESSGPAGGSRFRPPGLAPEHCFGFDAQNMFPVRWARIWLDACTAPADDLEHAHTVPLHDQSCILSKYLDSAWSCKSLKEESR